MKNIVIGSGPAGRLGSLELGKLGEEVTLIEKNHIAGTCLNEGCMVICALTDITKFIENNNKFNSLTDKIKANINDNISNMSY
uniref:FAD-dependent oxidoreductase n=1 Tax=uncultured Methanobrevibacter sp. TaxID=253161 RepID=UPI00258B0B10